MPPVRWRNGIIIVTTVFLHAFIGHTDANEGMQQPISMTADGWKPIVGSNREPPNHHQKEIKYYQNPILKETVKAEPFPSTTPSTTTIRVKRLEQKNNQAITSVVLNTNQMLTKGKIPPHTKHHPHQYFVLPNHGGHGPHIPLNAVSHRPILKKVPMISQHNHPNGMRIVKKPMVNHLATAHSTRNEVYVPAPSSGSYSFFSQGKNVRTRESSGLGIVGQKVYSLKQPHTHLDFSSHFPPSNLFHQLNSPVQHVIYQKQQINEIVPPYQIDSHQTLLPPPIFKNFADVNQGKYNHNGKINPDIRTPNDKIIFGHNPLGPNDLILQLPSYENSLFGFGKQKLQNQPNVQITKEKLHSFQNDIPQDFNHQQNKEFNQNFQTIRKPITQYPKSPTYEVTEGRYEDNTPAPPNKLYRPDSIQPLELNLPAFLPTPYRPDGVAPTSSSQNEISTIFGQLSNSVKHYPETYTHDPYYFNVKEVSTHFPILNKPEPPTTPQPQTDMHTNPAFRPSIEEITTPDLSKINIEKPNRINSNHRRRKPMTRYTTTTTEASTEFVTEKEEVSTTVKESEEVETERPYRSRRPIKNRPAENGSEEEAPEYNRVRNRYRKRPQENDSRKNVHRKRIRPSRYENEERTTLTPIESESKEQDVTEVLPIIQHFTTQGFRDFDKDLIDPELPPEPYTKSSILEDEAYTKFKTSESEEGSSEQEDAIVNNYSEIRDIRNRKRPNNDNNPDVSIQQEDVTVNNFGDIRDVRHRKRPNHENNPDASSQQEDVTINNFGDIRYKQKPNRENYNQEEYNQPEDAQINNFGDIKAIRQKYRPSQYENNQEISTAVYENVYHNEGVTVTSPANFENSEEVTLKEIPKKHKRPKIHYTTTSEPPITITTDIPENEVDFPTIKTPQVISLFDTQEISKITTTSEPETTTLNPTTTKSHRRRPIKYNASSRPKFSVKDYRNRLNQYSSTTSTETPRSSTSDNVRVRFPTRLRRPLTTTTTEATTIEETGRTKFVPKEPRHSSPHSVNNEVITEKNVRSVNTRLRPFGRMKTTTEYSSTTLPKVSIKPNLFSNRRRPTPISLKARIQNRNTNKTTDANNKENEFTTEATNQEENTSVVNDNQISSTNENLTASEKEDTISSPDIMKNDAYMYSQRVSDLTSSMKNDYDGFKAVPSSSRRIPNYYTISTEDPILPLEAFFSNINEKVK